MQFLADVHLKCEACNGKKFKEEILEVQYKGKNIYAVLELSVDEAMDFFAENNDIVQKLAPLRNVGLGYVKLGQSSSTLSGGEAQRVKLASFLTRGSAPDPILFIFDEPTTGLHFHDINKLISSFNQLIEAGHSVLVIEHNMDVIKWADWLIDLGPEGGVVTYIDRVALSFAAPFISRDLGLDSRHMGLAFTAFGIAYAMFEIPGGYLGDRLGPRSVLMRIVLWWSFFTAATGSTWNFLSIATTQFLFGAGEAGCFPNLTKTFTTWLPEKERVRAQGIMWLSARWGGAFTPPLVELVMGQVGWRHTFQIFGGLGVI